MFQCHIICINDIIYTWFFVWNIYTIIVINWSLKKHVLNISWQFVEKEFSLYTLDEYFRWAEYAAMLVDFRLPEGRKQDSSAPRHFGTRWKRQFGTKKFGTKTVRHQDISAPLKKKVRYQDKSAPHFLSNKRDYHF